VLERKQNEELEKEKERQSTGGELDDVLDSVEASVDKLASSLEVVDQMVS